VFTRETELWLQAVSRFNWAKALERLRNICYGLESIADFVPCCADKLLSLCADPVAAMQAAVCASDAAARQEAHDRCEATLNRVLEETYGELEE
jgi:hypothetical protein